MVKKAQEKTKNNFKNNAHEIVDYINQNSPQNAEKFKIELAKKLIEIRNNPQGFPPEPYLQTKNNLYRFALVMKSWKIIFKSTNKLLVFLGIIHTARNPNEINNLRTNSYL